MRSSGVRGVLVYCSDYKCSHSTRLGTAHWPDDTRLSDLETRFMYKACGKPGADVRPDFHWETQSNFKGESVGLTGKCRNTTRPLSSEHSKWSDNGRIFRVADAEERRLCCRGRQVLFSYIDFNLRHLVEGYDDAGLLQPPWKGKSKVLNTADIAKAASTMLPWPEASVNAFSKIEYLRGLRNLVAHFAIRRFPDEDAFVFLAKSAKDYKKHFGGDPPPGAAVTAVLDGPILSGVIGELEGLQNWLAKLTGDIQSQIEHLIPSPKGKE
jgi:hypothetical protein